MARKSGRAPDDVWWKDRYFVTLIAALLTALALVGQAAINRSAMLDVEKQRLKSELIINAVRTGDIKEAIANLKFFIEAGFIEDPEGKIAKLVKEGRVPVLPPRSGIFSRDIEGRPRTGIPGAVEDEK